MKNLGLALLIIMILGLKANANNIIYLKSVEVSDEPGLVSTKPKQFRLIVDHDPNFIKAEKLEGFDAKKSPIIHSLVIVSKELNRKKPDRKFLENDYKFSLEADSSDSLEHIGFLRSTYLSDQQTIKKAQRLNFKLDVKQALEANQDISLDDTAITKVILKLRSRQENLS